MFQKTILIVDDEPAICANLQALLEARGHRVLTAANGAEAVDLARSAKPHVMLLDVKLPILSGLEVCRCLKEDKATKAIPIIMLTAMGTLGDVERAVECGADDYLTKPCDPGKVFDKLRQYL